MSASLLRVAWGLACAGAVLASCAMIYPSRGVSESREQWRVMTAPRGSTLTTSFGATCTTPCLVRVPAAPLSLTVEHPGYHTVMVRYDPRRPTDISVLSERGEPDAEGETILVDVDPTNVEFTPGRVFGGALPWTARVTRRLSITLAPG